MNNDNGESLDVVPTQIKELKQQVLELQLTVTKLERWIKNYEYEEMMKQTRNVEIPKKPTLATFGGNKEIK